MMIFLFDNDFHLLDSHSLNSLITDSSVDCLLKPVRFQLYNPGLPF